MRVFVAGATGALGARLVPQLIERGHEVVGTSRSEQKAAALRAQGAEAVVLDLLDADAQLELVRKRRFPIVGDGGGIWSFVHLEDAAAATVLALERGSAGIYNVVDDEPAPVRDWLPELAKTIGAKPPRRVPRRLARLVAGESGVVMMTETRGA